MDYQYLTGSEQKEIIQHRIHELEADHYRATLQIELGEEMGNENLVEEGIRHKSEIERVVNALSAKMNGRVER